MTDTTPEAPATLSDVLRVLVAAHPWHEETQLLGALRVLDTDGPKLDELLANAAGPAADPGVAATLAQLVADVEQLVAAGVDPDTIPAPVTPLPGTTATPEPPAPVEQLPVAQPVAPADPTVPPEPAPAPAEPLAPVVELPTSQAVPAGTVTPVTFDENGQPVVDAPPADAGTDTPADGTPAS